MNRLNELKDLASNLGYELWRIDDELIENFPDTFKQYDTQTAAAAIDMDEVEAKINGVISQLSEI